MSSAARIRRGKEDRPCDFCRRKKSRCVIKENENTCLVCQNYNVECLFIEAPKPRRKRTPRSPSTPDATIAAAPSASTSSRDDLVPYESPGIVNIQLRQPDDFDTSETPTDTLGLQVGHHSRYIAKFGSAPSVCSNERLHYVSLAEAFLLTPDYETPVRETDTDDLSQVQSIVSPHGNTLIALYFRAIHGSYPILHRPFHTARSEISYCNLSPALLAAIYLLALRYWSFDADLSASTKPNTAKLEAIARRALLHELLRPRLTTLSAGLLLVQYSDACAAEFTPQLMNVGYRLGIHADVSDWTISSWEKGLRKRIAWALYMQDTWSALGTGRPPFISTSNWSVQPLVHDDFSEDFAQEHDQEGSSVVKKGTLIFSYMVTLTEILASVLDDLWSMQTERELRWAGDQALELILQKAKPLQVRLREWYTSLPGTLSMASMQASKLSSAASLRLDYLATEATIHRRILSIAAQHTPAPELWNILLTAASARLVAAIEFVQGLKPNELISFWYTNSKTNLSVVGTLGIMLYTTATRPSDRAFFAEKLKAYQWALRVSFVAGAQFMKPALTLLETNMKALNVSGSRYGEQDWLHDGNNRIEQTAAATTGAGQNFDNWAMAPGDDFSGQNLFDMTFSTEIEWALT